MHLVHCLTHSTLGGGQQVVYQLVKSFQKSYRQVRNTVVLPPDGIYVERFRELGVRVEEFPFDRVSAVNFYRIVVLLTKLKPDIVHSHGKGAGLYVRSLPGLFLNAKFVHSFHGFHLPNRSWPRRIYLIGERIQLLRTEKIVNVSASEKDSIEKLISKVKDKSIIIGNVVDSEALMVEAKSGLPEEVKSFLGKLENPFVVTMVGRNDLVKNYPLAVEASKFTLGNNRRIVFIFVGLSSEDEVIAHLIKQYPGRVLAAGKVSNTAPIIVKSDVILITSKREGCPLVVFEAFAFGKPVVGTRVPGIEDVIDHGVNGLLCGESAALIAEALSLLESDSKLYNSLRMKALQSTAMADINSWASQYHELYLELMR